MKDLDLKYNRFKKIIAGWTKATEGICNISFDLENDTDVLETARHAVDTGMLLLIKELMEIPKDDLTILDDEWFWAEWDTSKECFFYIYGKTQMVRCERAMGPLDSRKIDWPEGGYILIWRGNYKTTAKFISNEYADKYFVESKGLAFGIRKKVLELSDGEFCSADEDGLFVFKG